MNEPQHDYERNHGNVHEQDYEPSVLRSFVKHSPVPASLAPTTEESMVRAYTMTNGRTRAEVVLAFEAIVRLIEPSPALNFSFEKAVIIDLCAEAPQSVAELAAHMSVPIGTARVLAGDLVHEEVLEAHMPQSNASTDVALLKRLIHGVSAL